MAKWLGCSHHKTELRISHSQFVKIWKIIPACNIIRKYLKTVPHSVTEVFWVNLGRQKMFGIIWWLCKNEDKLSWPKAGPWWPCSKQFITADYGVSAWMLHLVWLQYKPQGGFIAAEETWIYLIRHLQHRFSSHLRRETYLEISSQIFTLLTRLKIQQNYTNYFLCNGVLLNWFKKCYSFHVVHSNLLVSY